MKKSRCCEKPFIQIDTKTMMHSCIRCKSKWKIDVLCLYDCDDCNTKDVETDKILNLGKDDRPDWTACKTCDKEVNYRYKEHKRDIYQSA